MVCAPVLSIIHSGNSLSTGAQSILYLSLVVWPEELPSMYMDP